MTATPTDEFLAKLTAVSRELLEQGEDRNPEMIRLKAVADVAKAESFLELLVEERRIAYMFYKSSERFWKYTQSATMAIEQAKEDALMRKLESFTDDELVYELQRRLHDKE